MAVGLLKYSNFDEFLKKTGQADKLNEGQSGSTGGVKGDFASFVQIAKKSDVFTARQMYENGQTVQKEKSGSDGSSAHVSNPIQRFVNLINSNPVSETSEPTTNAANLDAAATGHTNQATAPVLPSAVREPSGNEATNPNQTNIRNSAQEEKIADLYQQFKDANNEGGVQGEQPQTTGEATLSASDNKVKTGETESPEKPDETPEAKTEEKTQPKSESTDAGNVKTPDENDTSNADNSKNIEKQEEAKQKENQEREIELKKAEQAKKMDEEDE